MQILNVKLFMKAIATLLSFTMAVYPFHTFGITPDVTGREGQAYGKQLSDTFRFPVQSGGLIEFGDGETINPSDLAPQGDGLYVTNPDVGGLQGVYDSDSGMEGAGMAAQGSLYNDASKENPDTISGSAYKVILGVSDARNEFPDLTNDPIVVGSGEAMVDEGLLDSFGDCSVETKVEETSRPVRVPEPEYCTRVTAPQGEQSCKIRHDIEIKRDQVRAQESITTPVIVVGDSYCKGHYIRGSGVQDTRVIDLSPYIGDYCAANTSNRSASVSVVSITGSHSYPGGPKPADGMRCNSGLSTGNINYSGISCVSGRPQISISSTPNGGGITRRKTTLINSVQFRINLNYDKTATNIVDNWGPQECIDRALDRKAAIADIGRSNKGALFAYADPLDRTGGQFGFIKPGGTNAFSGFNSKEVNDNPYDSGFCSTTATVTAGAKNNQECINVRDNTGASHPICPGNSLYNKLKPSPIPGIPKAATEVTVVSGCNSFNQGQMDCYVDIHGETQCPYNNGDNVDECREFEDDPTCAFVKSECIEGARGEESGHCYAYEDEYDCGVTVNIPSYEKTDNISCGGPVRCMGADCLDPMKPPSAASDFAKAAALLDAAQSMAQDMECNPDGTGCKVFSGDVEECKTAVGGMVNCCEKPKGVSLSDYITTIRAVPKFDKAMTNLANKNNPFASVGRGYEAIADPVKGSFQTITKPIASHVENISGAIKGFKDTAMETIDKVASKAVNTVKGALGKGAGTEAGKQAGESIISSVMNSPAMAYLQTVMAIYTIYVVATVIISMIWKCTKKEFELGSKRQLKSCSKVGSYCKKKILGACIEKRQAFCCFASPLSRIMQEQIRPQIGKSFGRAKSPDCSGLPVESFAAVDWDRVNLDEWLGILQVTGNFPATTGLNFENMTGSGSNFDTSGNRLNSIDRNLNRLEGADIDLARKEAAKTVPITTGAPSQ